MRREDLSGKESPMIMIFVSIASILYFTGAAFIIIREDLPTLLLLTVLVGLVVAFIGLYICRCCGHWLTSYVLYFLSQAASSLIYSYTLGLEANSGMAFLIILYPSHIRSLNTPWRFFVFGVFIVSFYSTGFAPLTMGFETTMSTYNLVWSIISIVLKIHFSVAIEKRIMVRTTQELTVLSYTDALTSLMNRRYAENFFKAIPKYTVLSSMALVDIDDFKKVNDLYGHRCGDNVLKGLGEFMSQSFRESDLVSRWGGEEFLLVIIAPLAVSCEILERFRLGVKAQQFECGGDYFSITVTIGVSEIRGGNIKEALISCDKKLYQGKGQGKDQVVS